MLDVHIQSYLIWKVDRICRSPSAHYSYVSWALGEFRCVPTPLHCCLQIFGVSTHKNILTNIMIANARYTSFPSFKSLVHWWSLSRRMSHSDFCSRFVGIVVKVSDQKWVQGDCSHRISGSVSDSRPTQAKFLIESRCVNETGHRR